MKKQFFGSLAVATSLVTVISGSLLTSTASAQSYPYTFCQQETETPTQELVDSIAFVLNDNYQGGVTSVTPVCYGGSPRGDNRPAWIYTAQFGNGTSLDVAIAQGDNDRLISIHDTDKASARATGWTAWITLKSPY